MVIPSSPWGPESAVVVAKCGEISSGIDNVVCWWLWLPNLSSLWLRRPIGNDDTEFISATATRRITECGMPGQMFWIDVEDYFIAARGVLMYDAPLDVVGLVDLLMFVL